MGPQRAWGHLGPGERVAGQFPPSWSEPACFLLWSMFSVRNSEQPAFLLGAQAGAASSALGTPGPAGLGGSQACSVLAVSTSRMSGGLNPCRLVTATPVPME